MKSCKFAMEISSFLLLLFFFPLLLFIVEIQWFFQRQEVQALHFGVGVFGEVGWREKWGAVGGEKEGHAHPQKWVHLPELLASRASKGQMLLAVGESKHGGGSHSPEAGKTPHKAGRPRMTHFHKHLHGCRWDGERARQEMELPQPPELAQQPRLVTPLQQQCRRQRCEGSPGCKCDWPCVTGRESWDQGTPGCLVYLPPSPSHTRGTARGAASLWGPAHPPGFDHTAGVFGQAVGSSQTWVKSAQASILEERTSACLGCSSKNTGSLER